MKRIGVLTSGGDSPGMNAAVRGVVRAAIAHGTEVVGFMRGYQGIIDRDFVPMESKTVGGIISRGGTILRTARSQDFREADGRRLAMANLNSMSVQGLVVIGGDGSLTGAKALFEEFHFPVMGVPGSIDNDIAGTDYSIGFDTAVNTAVEAIDRVRDTAYSHDRVFVIEVMGRSNGFIALEAGIAAGAEAVLLPELPFSLNEVCEDLLDADRKGKKSCIVICAEGAMKAEKAAVYIQDLTGFEVRALVLGHMQRGGAPTAFDRVLALRLATHATQRLLAGVSGEMAGLQSGRLVTHPLSYVLGTTCRVDPCRMELLRMMAQ